MTGSIASWSGKEVWMTRNSARLATEVVLLLRDTNLFAYRLRDGDQWPYVASLEMSTSTAVALAIVPRLEADPLVAFTAGGSGCSSVDQESQLPNEWILVAKRFAPRMSPFFPSCALDPKPDSPCTDGQDGLRFVVDNVTRLRSYCAEATQCSGAVAFCSSFASAVAEAEATNTSIFLQWDRTFAAGIDAGECIGNF
jgi:hypothetical protein